MSPSAPSLLDLKIDGPLAFLRLDDGKGNALGTPMLRALEKALDDAEPARVLVITGREKLFSGGLDLLEIVPYDRPAMNDFLALFDRVFLRLFSYPRSIVTAARGAGIAGGAILLATGDERLVTPNGDVGTTEVVLGLSLPTTALEIVRTALGERNGFEAMATGRVYRGDERVRVGFATEVVAPEALDARARELAAARAQLDPAAVAQVRHQLRRTAIERISTYGKQDTEDWLDTWFAPQTRERLKATVERLRAKQAG